jgi:hypothetical protein
MMRKHSTPKTLLVRGAAIFSIFFLVLAISVQTSTAVRANDASAGRKI